MPEVKPNSVTAQSDTLLKEVTFAAALTGLERRRKDAELMRQIANGSSTAMEELTIWAGPFINQVSASILGVRSPQVYEDVQQEVLFAVWRQAKDYDPEKGNLGTWIGTFTRRLCVSILRTEGRIRRDIGERREYSQENVFAQDTKIRSILDLLHSSERFNQIKRLAEKFDPNWCDVVSLIFMRGLSQTQFAEATAVPLGTVKAHCVAVKKFLQSRIREID